MDYVLCFLEGIITFISPCLLPMIPVYVIYFAGNGERGLKKILRNSSGFVLGFTVVFVAMGAFAGVIGSFMVKYKTVLNIITGLLVTAFGLNYLGVFGKGFFRAGPSGNIKERKSGFFGTMLFGMIFSFGWTPCIGAFLGSALAMASNSGHVLKGMLMLLVYSLGLGIPFIISALLIDSLKNAFDFIKRHYKVINTVSGALLIVIGVLMMTGLMDKFMTLIS